MFRVVVANFDIGGCREVINPNMYSMNTERAQRIKIVNDADKHRRMEAMARPTKMNKQSKMMMKVKDKHIK